MLCFSEAIRAMRVDSWPSDWFALAAPLPYSWETKKIATVTQKIADKHQKSNWNIVLPSGVNEKWLTTANFILV